MTSGFSRAELLIAVVARLLDGCRHVVTGAASPIPGAAALLARELSGGSLRVSYRERPDAGGRLMAEASITLP